MLARALWITGPGMAGLREEAIAPPGPGEALLRMRWSAVSRGTERLVFEGRVPPCQHERMRGPGQAGDFGFPVKYGYCAVAQVEQGPPEWLGRTVFALHPHQDRFVLPVEALAPVPDVVPPRRATLAANMETALNAVWDSGAGPGDRVVVVGAGAIGALIAFLCARLPGSETCLVDLDPGRAAIAQAIGARFSTPERAPGEADVVFHASGTSAGLATALALAGEEANVVEASWHGDSEARLPLGGAFHSRRLRLVSTQVSLVAQSRRPRWSRARRLVKALELLADPALDALPGEEVAFDDLPAALPRLLARGGGGLAPLVRY